MRSLKRWTVQLVGGVVAASVALGSSAEVASAQLRGQQVGLANYSGTRTEDAGQIVTNGAYAENNFTVSWAITDAGAGLLRYTYTFSGFGGRGSDISHLVVGLSANCADDDACLSGATLEGQAITFAEEPIATHQGSGNPGIGMPLFGAKFDVGGGAGDDGLTYSFLSNRVAVWGDFYAKGGGGTGDGSSWAQNKAMTVGFQDSNDAAFFIARPDGVVNSVVPEPSTYALLGTGLLGLMGVASRRRARQG